MLRRWTFALPASTRAVPPEATERLREKFEQAARERRYAKFWAHVQAMKQPENQPQGGEH